MGDEKTTAPDRSLKEAAGVLGQEGFARVRQVTRARVAVGVGGKFRVSSVTPLGRIEFQGELIGVSGEQLEVLLEVAVPEGQSEAAAVSTQIRTRPDHDVVIGVAGATSDFPSLRSAFVIRLAD